MQILTLSFKIKNCLHLFSDKDILRAIIPGTESDLQGNWPRISNVGTISDRQSRSSSSPAVCIAIGITWNMGQHLTAGNAVLSWIHSSVRPIIWQRATGVQTKDVLLSITQTSYVTNLGFYMKQTDGKGWHEKISARVCYVLGYQRPMTGNYKCFALSCN